MVKILLSLREFYLKIHFSVVFFIFNTKPGDRIYIIAGMTGQLRKTILTLIFLFPLLIYGQDKAFPLSISLFNEATAIPFTKIVTLPVHPGVQAGTDFNYRLKEHSRIFQTANFSYFYHNHLNQGLGISSELGYEYRTGFGLALSGLLGIGYMHTFATTEEFTFKNGQYGEKADRGNARFFPSLSIDAGYYLFRESERSPKIFIRYQSWIEYPYSPDFIPVMTHINLHAGVRFFINKRRAQDEGN